MFGWGTGPLLRFTGSQRLAVEVRQSVVVIGLVSIKMHFNLVFTMEHSDRLVSFILLRSRSRVGRAQCHGFYVRQVFIVSMVVTGSITPAPSVTSVTLGHYWRIYWWKIVFLARPAIYTTVPGPECHTLISTAGHPNS